MLPRGCQRALHGRTGWLAQPCTGGCSQAGVNAPAKQTCCKLHTHPWLAAGRSEPDQQALGCSAAKLRRANALHGLTCACVRASEQQGSGLLRWQEQLELCWELLLAVQPVREVDSPYPAVGVYLDAQRLDVVGACNEASSASAWAEG